MRQLGFLTLFAGVALAADPPPVPPAKAKAPEVATPRVTLASDKGFFDDPLAVEPGAGRFAFVRTDSASFARAEIADAETGKIEIAFDAGDPARLWEQIHFAEERKGLVLVSSDGGRRTAQFFDAAGKAAGSAGTATAFAASRLGGERVLVGYDERPDGKGLAVTVTAYKLDGLAKIGKARAQRIGKEGELAGTGVRLVAWQEGYTKIAGIRAGGFDKKKDMRLPDRAAVVDALSGAIVAESEITDVLGAALISKLRKERPNRTAFVVATEDESGLELVDGKGTRHKLGLAVPFAHYDAGSLREQEGPEAGTLTFSLTVDPVNPDALRQQKAVKPDLDVYAVDLRGGVQVGLRLRVRGDERPVGWAAGWGRLVLLRKHKGFSRGGTALEVYDLR